ncbi:exodeoxyribonuclease I [Methylococcus capsulatus]|uniref:exodeoxyribonuclease I n=1 Tax=Methylococcus capsulatus TaxID=414 RepID=UPI001C528122|nr:exodeoxyribonuclease I [Methylococcus capsulatus]QXP87041.1 exodeoxyribonuclease I [Methylococcus capsulatus]QXP91612.1 exodeoxyribonuclease I [Methylococcus capsulatus]QXP93279.1 exodeoxyribonuclease I [Methylococcus capsulatus]UQN12026.1 exodeoxyribonuclease I [Methylococcus capsulatus]
MDGAPSFYWYDLETFGTDPARDRIAQFAGLRTDLEFNPIGPPDVLYCRPSDDMVPYPDACLVTGITPQYAAELGVPESAFIATIHRIFMRPGTCVLGYNTLRFDDEMLRHAFYRNLYDPYAREWKGGNSRWDVIDLARLTQALRPDGIEWPRDSLGSPVFKLERLAAANGIRHESAHDALSDVRATVAFARLIAERQPRLFQFALESRAKGAVERLLALGAWQPVLHVSEKFSASRHCIACVLPLCRHPRIATRVIVFDLASDPAQLSDLSVDEIRHRLFTPSAELPAATGRLPLKGVHTNRCPVVVPMSALRPADGERLGIDAVLCRRRARWLQDHAEDIIPKISAAFEVDASFEAASDPELMLYRGGFIPDADRRALDQVHRLTPDQLAHYRPRFVDGRFDELLFRFRARNFPETLNAEERERWAAFRRARLAGIGGGLSLAEFFSRIDRLRSQESDAGKRAILDALEVYGRNLSG